MVIVYKKLSEKTIISNFTSGNIEKQHRIFFPFVGYILENSNYNKKVIAENEKYITVYS
jgi:hypothetical protein